jgi:hypothetical protein
MSKKSAERLCQFTDQKSSDFSDSQDVMSSTGSNFAALLQRSRSSRVRKPLSIRAAMQQAATYSNLSRSTTSNSSHPSTHSNHSATPSTSTIQSRQSSTPSSTSGAPAHAGSIQMLSAVTADLYDGATHTTSSRKPISDTGRRKRPAFLALQPEESNNVVEGRDVHTKRNKDQLRKSSPTVGENFTFVPGEPPLEDLPPPPPKDMILSKKSNKDKERLNRERPPSPTLPPGPLYSEPPNVPLPKPPSRSPSRSRSPGPPKIPSRAPSRTDGARAGSRAGSRSGYLDRRTVSALTSHQVTLLEEQPENQSIPEVDEIVEPQEEATYEEYSEAENGQSQPPTPPEDESPISQPPSAGLPQPRKQKSSSSVRSQIIALPETARLRKEASAEALRKQPSAERLYSRAQVEEPVPALPMTGVVGYVRGNAFGRQGSHFSYQPFRSPPPRSSSIEGLSEQNRKRSATDLGNETQVYSLSLRPKRGISRSASDARRPPNLRFPAPQQADEGSRHSPVSAALGSPLSQEPTSANSETWPLTPETGHTSDYNHGRNYSAQHSIQYLQPGDHSRNTSSERSFAPSSSTSRTLSPDQTPRASRSNTPYSGTPRAGRSRTNTLMTIASEAGEREMIDDGMSTAGSVAPSVMSAQWFRTPRERLGLGTRMSRADALPWESGAFEESGPPVPPKTQAPPSKTSRMGSGVANMFSVFPPRAPSRMKDEERFNESPPRSPLLTQSFLSDVQTTLPKDRGAKNAEEAPRPSTSMKSSRDGAITPDWARKKSKKDKAENEKEKKKKDSRFPTLGDMVKEYKNMGNSWYTSAYAQAAEEQRIEKEIREGKRPATGSTSSSRLGATTSLDVQIQSPTTAGSGSGTKSLRTIPSSIDPRPSGETGSSQSGTMDGRQTMDGRDAKDEKQKKKDRKKSSAFPTVKEMWSEYKKNADHWYTATYQEEETRNVATPHSHFS